MVFICVGCEGEAMVLLSTICWNAAMTASSASSFSARPRSLTADFISSRISFLEASVAEIMSGSVDSG